MAPDLKTLNRRKHYAPMKNINVIIWCVKVHKKSQYLACEIKVEKTWKTA